MPIRQSATVLALACLLPTLARAVPAQPVVVTATRLGSSRMAQPANVTVITDREIAASTASTLPQLLAQQAGLITRSLYGNDSLYATVGLRGFGATATQNTLILLNGRRLNPIDLSPVDFAAIPLRSIKRIEIIRGGGGVLYGDGAVGGAINIITRKGGRAGTRAHLRAAVGSFATRKLDASAGHTGNGYSVHAAAQGIDSNGYRANSALQRRDIQADLSLPRANGEWFLRAGGDSQRQRLPGARTVNPAKGVNQLASDPQGTDTPNDWANENVRRVSGGYTHDWDNGVRAVIDVGYRDTTQKAFYASYAQYLDTDISTWSFTPRLTLPGKALGHAVHTVMGLDYYHSSYTSNRSQSPATAATPVHHLTAIQKSLALYGQSRIALGASTSLTFGARLEQVRIALRDRADPSAPGGTYASQAPPADRIDHVDMLDLMLDRRLRPDLSVYLRTARSVRLAKVDEMFQTNGAPLYLQVFSPLKPQTGLDVGAGVAYTPGQARFSADVYDMRLKDEIALDPATFSNVNLDPTRRYGVELSARMRVTQRLNVTGSYAYMRAQFRAGPYAGNNVPLVPRNSASLAGHWRLPHGSWVSATVRYVGSEYFANDPANDFGAQIPAYTLVDLKAGRRWHQWTVTAAVHNLMNRNAYAYGYNSTFTPGAYSAYPLPGRTFTLSVGLAL